MVEFEVLNITTNPEFNWAFTQVVAFFPVLFSIKAVIRVISRS